MVGRFFLDNIFLCIKKERSIERSFIFYGLLLSQRRPHSSFVI